MESDKQLETPITCLDSEKRFQGYFGMYPLIDKNFVKNTRIYYLKLAGTLVMSASFFLSIWTNIFLNLDDSSVVIETLYFGLTQLTFCSKFANIQLRKAAFSKLVAYLELPIFNSYTKEQQALVTRAIYVSSTFGKLFRVLITMTIVFFIIFPFLDNSLLVVPSYFPVDNKKYRPILFIFQMVGITLNGYTHSGFDIVVVTLITIGCAEFEILKDNLVNLTKGLDSKYENREDNDKICMKRLSVIVYHHVTTIEFVYKIEELFSFVQFIQFLASSIIICVTGFQIIVTPFTSWKFVTLILYFSCNLMQVTMLCWFGHDVLTKSEGVGDSCYMSDWNHCGTNVRRTLFIIMERSKRPIVLTANKFFALTLQTLMQVLKTSYSYLALLRTMNESKEFEF